jgi:D-alanine-D-alanine ligase
MGKPNTIWVLYGGSSAEREVSLRSGKGIHEALNSKGFQSELFDVRPGESLQSLNWRDPPDLVFIGLHGTFGEDGVIQGFLESQKIKYVGSDSKSSSLCFNKGLTKKVLQSHGVAVPQGFEFHGESDYKHFLRSSLIPRDFFKTDWFIKPAREGSTVGIERYEGSVASSQQDFEKKLLSAMKFDSYILIEEWIKGPEITVPLMFGKALPSVEIRPLSQFYDYESKYTKGKTEYLCPAQIPPQMEKTAQELAEKSFRYLECFDYGRVDIMLAKEGPKILEMNTLPGMTETSLVPKSAKVAGMSYADFLERLVNYSFERQTKRYQ